MLDIDFLSAARPSLRQHVVYRYSSGLLRGPVRIRLEQLYEAKGMTCCDAVPDDPFPPVESFFFDQAIFIDTVRFADFSALLPVFLPNLERRLPIP